MRILIQRVSRAKVSAEGTLLGEIAKGLLVLVGVAKDDNEKDAENLAVKTVNLRIMSDKENKMNLSVLDVTGEILAVSQFTLYADTSAGRRPSFINSAEPAKAEKLYEYFIVCLKKQGIKKVASGRFGAYMMVELVNDGPVTLMICSPPGCTC